MHESTVVLVGSVATDLRHLTSINGHPKVQFRLAVNERRYDRTQEKWVDCDASFYTVIAWRDLADNIAMSLHKGDPVIVAGRLRVREWITDDGQRGSSTEVIANSVGHDLARGTALFTRVTRAIVPPAVPPVTPQAVPSVIPPATPLRAA